jgi:chromosome segregation ATPase
MMQNEDEDVRLTSLGNRDKLDDSVDKANAVFTVVSNSFDTKNIQKAKDALVAINNPEKVQGWDRPWSEEEKKQLEEFGAVEKCSEIQNMANSAKNNLEKASSDMTGAYNDITELSIQNEEITRRIEEMNKIIAELEARLDELDDSDLDSDTIAEWKVDAIAQLDELQDAKKILEMIPQQIVLLRNELSEVTDQIPDLFLSSGGESGGSLPMNQSVDELTAHIDELHEKTSNAHNYQKGIIDKLGSFFSVISSKCKEMVGAIGDMLSSSKDICDGSRDLLDRFPAPASSPEL